MDNGSWLPFPAVYEGGTHLPLTDGGTRDFSIFKTGFGPPEGEPPPIEARQSLSALTKWHTDLNRQLAQVQKLLDRIPTGSAADQSANLFGQAIWAEEARGRFADSWRSIEIIAKHDFEKRRATPRMIFDTIRRRAKQGIEPEPFLYLKRVRNMVTHSSPSQTVSRDVHLGADRLLRCAY